MLLLYARWSNINVYNDSKTVMASASIGKQITQMDSSELISP